MGTPQFPDLPLSLKKPVPVSVTKLIARPQCWRAATSKAPPEHCLLLTLIIIIPAFPNGMDGQPHGLERVLCADLCTDREESCNGEEGRAWGCLD